MKPVLIICLLVLTAQAQAVEEIDLERIIKEQAARDGITDDAAMQELTNTVRGIVQMREWASFSNLRAPCAAELTRWCASASTSARSNSCLKRNRDSVSESCELAMRKEFDGRPLSEATLHNGVLLPVGSDLIYDNDGRIIGAIPTAPVTVNGMKFQAGQIRWHRNGSFWTGSLVDAQVINGIKFVSTGIGIFFHDNGRVENSILAEDTIIDGVTYKGGKQIQFYPTGRVSSAYLAGSEEFVAYNPDGSRQPVRPTIVPLTHVLVASSATKPMCAPGVRQTVECLPRRFANLPSDPGERGKATLKGVDSDGDGLRDDVQRFIALNWGFSERAVNALSAIARNVQKEIEIGGDVSRDDAYELAKISGRAVSCYSRSVDDKITYSSALEQVIKAVTNTPERAKRYRSFDALLSGRVFTLDDAPASQLCGYDPAVLTN